MNIRHLLSFALATLLMTGCATTGNYEKMLNSWIGSSTDALINGWGIPDKTYSSGDKKYFEYDSTSSVYIPASPSSYKVTTVGNTTHMQQTGGSSGRTIYLDCKTTFTIIDDKVVSWRHQGNDCKK